MSHDCEDGEYAEVYVEREPTARKEYKCGACGEAIRVGDSYSYTFIVFEGEASNVRRCARCQKIHLHLRDKCRDLRRRTGDDKWPADRLDCGEDYEENWGEEPPEDIAALAFALPGEVEL